MGLYILILCLFNIGSWDGIESSYSVNKQRNDSYQLHIYMYVRSFFSHIRSFSHTYSFREIVKQYALIVS